MKQYLRLLSYLYPYRLRLGAAFACAPRRRPLRCLCLAGSAGVGWSLYQQGRKSAPGAAGGHSGSGGAERRLQLRAELFDELCRQPGDRGHPGTTLSKLVRLPVRFHDTNTSGRLVSRVINDVNQMANAVAGVLKDLFQQGLTFLAMIGVIIYQNWKLAMVSMIVVPLSVVTMARMGKKLRGLATRGQERMGDMASTLQETLAGIRMVKSFGREEEETKRFRQSNDAFIHTTMKAIQVSSLGSSHMEVIGVLGVAGIIWYGGYLVIHDEMTPGAFFSFLAAMFMAYTPIRRLSGANNTVQQAMAAAERVFDVLDLPTEQQENGGLTDLPAISRSLEFRQIAFRYDGQADAALTGIDLTIRAGRSLHSWAAAGAARPPWSACCRGFTSRPEGRS